MRLSLYLKGMKYFFTKIPKTYFPKRQMGGTIVKLIFWNNNTQNYQIHITNYICNTQRITVQDI